MGLPAESCMRVFLKAIAMLIRLVTYAASLCSSFSAETYTAVGKATGLTNHMERSPNTLREHVGCVVWFGRRFLFQKKTGGMGK